MNKIEVAKMLMKFYNMQAGTCFKVGDNQSKIDRICEFVESAGDVSSAKNIIRAWVQTHPEEAKEGAMSAIESMMAGLGSHQKELGLETPATKVADSQVQYSMGLLEQAVVQLISNMNAEKIEQNIMGSVEEKVRQFIKDEYGSIERKITTVVDGKKAQMQGIQHDKFETVLKFVANDEPVFLTGPAGSGKNVLCKQVAQALGLNFYFTNAVTQEYQLKGFTDAMGNYQPTQFYKAFTEGGLFMLDEMDASIPEVLVILNAAIANRYFDFPAPIGFVQAHPDFRVIAAGNTTGHGADFEYVGRNQLDSASLDRFAIVKIDYSEAIENAVSNGNHELVQFCRDFRKSAEKAGIKVVVSYRAISRLAKMLNILTVEEAIDTCLVKGLEKDDINIIYNGIYKDSQYKQALKKIVEVL